MTCSRIEYPTQVCKTIDSHAVIYKKPTYFQLFKGIFGGREEFTQIPAQPACSLPEVPSGRLFGELRGLFPAKARPQCSLAAAHQLPLTSYRSPATAYRSLSPAELGRRPASW